MLKKQILEFVIKNWKAILIVSLLAIVALKNKKDYSLMQKAYETQAESHQAQIEGLKEIHVFDFFLLQCNNIISFNFF